MPLRQVVSCLVTYVPSPRGLVEQAESRVALLSCGHRLEIPWCYGEKQAWTDKHCPVCAESVGVRS